MMHLDHVAIHPEKFPATNRYPFNLRLFQVTDSISFLSPVTFLIGENGAGKSTLLKALSRKCNIHIWEDRSRTPCHYNPYENALHRAIDIGWTNGSVPGSFFSSEIFKNFSQILDEWAKTDEGIFDYFGGKSLLKQSHGQSILSFCESRFRIKGLYFLDEPETALSPKSQIKLVNLIIQMSRGGSAQFIIATHSPILMACPGARLFSFDDAPICEIDYADTDYYRFYKNFMNHPEKYLGNRDFFPPTR